MASFGSAQGFEHKDPPLVAAAPYVAEFVGTFMLVFTVGVCSVAGDALWNATAIATMLMVMIYGFGPVSGGHFNPSVSLACGVTGKTPWPKVCGYIVVQVVAGLLAGWIYWGVFHEAATVGPKGSYTWFHVGIAELVYTAMLCFAHLNCATSKRNNPQDDQNHFFGLAIGFVIVAGGYAAGGISGASLNPAVTLGLDVTGAGNTGSDGRPWRLAYCCFEVLGAGLAALLLQLCRSHEVGLSLDQEGSGRCLQVQIISAHDLANRDSGMFGDVSDAYVTARVGVTEFRTPTISNNLNPVWTTDNVFLFTLTSISPQIDEPSLLTLEVMNSNAVLKDQSLGSLTIDLRELQVEQLQRRRDRLLGGQNAEIEYAVRICDARMAGEPSLPAKLASEFLGTFVLVLTVGMNLVTRSPATPWSAAAALMSMIYSLGDVSGGHFNPAVTAAVVLSRRGKCPPGLGFAYVAVQLLAGVLAGLLYADFHFAGPNKTTLFGLVPGAGFSWWAVFFAELTFTAMLAFVVLAVATTRPPASLTERNFQFALAIGSCVTAGGIAVGAISGGSLNPAVSWGISTASSANSGTFPSPPNWSQCIWFSIFELVGGALAAAVFYGTHVSEYRKEAGIGF